MNILSKANTLWASAVTLLAAVLGEYWYLFAAFLILNAVDYGTGIAKAKINNIENSTKGAQGVFKKVGYWIVIGIAFFISASFADMGASVGVDLSWMNLLGWFTLATFIINEIRSILENLVLCDVDVPEFLIKGLEVAAKAIDEKNGGENK